MKNFVFKFNINLALLSLINNFICNKNQMKMYYINLQLFNKAITEKLFK